MKGGGSRETSWVRAHACCSLGDTPTYLGAEVAFTPEAGALRPRPSSPAQAVACSGRARGPQGTTVSGQRFRGTRHVSPPSQGPEAREVVWVSASLP